MTLTQYIVQVVYTRIAHHNIFMLVWRAIKTSLYDPVYHVGYIAPEYSIESRVGQQAIYHFFRSFEPILIMDDKTIAGSMM